MVPSERRPTQAHPWSVTVLLAAAAASPACAQTSALPAELQIRLAVQAAPEPLRDGATVQGYDAKGALVMEDLMERLLQKQMHRIRLDFDDVPFISSAGVGILLGMASSLRAEGGDISFVNVSPKIRSVFRLLNLDDFFEITDSPQPMVES